MHCSSKLTGCLTLSLYVAAGAAAALERPAPALSLLRAAAVDGDADSVAVTVDEAAYARLWRAPEARLADLPLPDGRSVDLVLTGFEVIIARSRFYEVGDAGRTPVTAPPMRFYRGRIDGETDSSAYLWLSDGRAGGFLMRPGETFLFGPSSPQLTSGLLSEHRVSRASATDSSESPYCSTDSLPLVNGLRERLPVPVAELSTVLKRATVSFDATRELRDRLGSTSATLTYILSLLGAASTVYHDELNCLLDAGDVHVFATTGPYTGGDNLILLLDQVQARWTSDPALIASDRSAVHLLTARGGTGGVAYADVLCDRTYGYGVSDIDAVYTYPTPSYTWDLDVFAHELGHNFGSLHTHCYQPPIDKCYGLEPGCYFGPVLPSTGTIMSYCHQTVAGKAITFHQRVIEESIRPAIEAAGCIPAAAGADELLISYGSGLFRFDYFAIWDLFDPKPAELLATGDLEADGLDNSVVDFGDGVGLWHKNGWQWKRIHSLSPVAMQVADVDGNGQDDLAVDFGAGVGLWLRFNNSAWRKLNSVSPTAIAAADIDGDGRDALVFVFFNGLWTWRDGTGWRRLNSQVPEGLAAGDLDGSGVDDVLVDFGGLGLWGWFNNSGWRLVHLDNPQLMAAGDLDGSGADDLAVSLADGLWLYFDDSSWRRVESDLPTAMTAGQVSFGAADALVAAFADGLWLFRDASYWEQIHGTPPVVYAAGDIDGIDGR